MSIHEVLPNTYSPNNLELIASWVARCSSGHSLCTPQSSTGFFHPTRLLDTCSSNDMSTITLVESSELRSLRSRSRYLASSHCWGGNAPVVLTSINKDSFKSGINLSELPKTFQHAVALARFVHVRYLWIDSLCIIQDSNTDWEFEATTMKDVYRHAFSPLRPLEPRLSTMAFISIATSTLHELSPLLYPGKDYPAVYILSANVS